MDLIYQNAERIDQGVMKHYEMDLAYGRDENDFELRIDADEHCLEEDYILYMEGTEYGGIVDAIESSNIDDTVVYSGRTWHGILEGKVFEPEEGQNFMILNGNANEVLRYLLEKWELTDLFSVVKEDSQVKIIDYKTGYEKGYTGIRKMLFEFGGKLKMIYKDRKVVISAEPYQDYSNDEEFDSSRVYFTIKKNYHPVNHLICRGTGKQDEVYVMHLFTDADGGIQPYAFVENPIMDSDYIPTKKNQKLFGKDEVTDVIDCGNVQVTENYVMLKEIPANWGTDADEWNDVLTDIYTMDEEGKFVQSKAKEKTLYELQKTVPSDWKEKYDDYYVKDEKEEEEGEGDGYKKASFEKEDVYTLQTAKPLDWAEKFDGYYYLDKEQYKKVKPVIEDIYSVCKKKPGDWTKIYKDFYEKHSDGLKITYEKVRGIPKYRYRKQTSKPSDWEENYGSYYRKSGKRYVANSPKYQKQNKRPEDWQKKFSEYYRCVTDGTETVYQQISAVTKNSYELQTKKPTDWGDNYNGYYEKNAKGKYVAVSIKSYEPLKERPADWNKKYADYFYIYSDGTKEEYRSVQGVRKDNYILQTGEPTDWSSNYDGYYEKNAEGKYVKVSIKGYLVLTEQPSDWNQNYKDYFYIYSDGTKEEYRSVQGAGKDNYILQTSEPTDWSSNYDEYYYRDGTEYKKVNGIKKDDKETAPVWSADSYYTKETVTAAPEYASFSAVYKKEDTPVWSANTYYTKETVTTAPEYSSFSMLYGKGDAPKWKKKTYYTKKSEQKAPSYDSVKPVYAVKAPLWNKCARYSRTTVEAAPEWVKNRYYVLSKEEKIPEWKGKTYYTLTKVANPLWEENTFYTKVKRMVAPVWSDAVYYRKFPDHYAGLVEKGMDYFAKHVKKDELSISLEPDMVYDINDIVGAKDNATKQSVWMPITKKILKITENTETVEYEVGE